MGEGVKNNRTHTGFAFLINDKDKLARAAAFRVWKIQTWARTRGTPNTHAPTPETERTDPAEKMAGEMSWVGKKIHLYNVTMGLYMLDWWERCLFSILPLRLHPAQFLR
jgi:hypothetical protein